MPIIDVTTRITEIQTTIEKISVAPATTTATSPSATAFAAEIAAVAEPSSSTGTASGAGIVEAAKKYIGVPYVFGGEDSSGMDCSGLVQTVLKDLGIDAPRLASQQATIGREVTGGLANAQPGDLILTHNSDHVVIYAGDGMIIHAPYAGRTVSLQKNYLDDSDIQTIRRVTPEASPASVASVSPVTTGLADLVGQAQSALVTSGQTKPTQQNTVADLLALISGIRE